MNFKKIWFVLLLLVTGCTETVPPGYFGMKLEPSGLDSSVLTPGAYLCYGRDRLVLIPTEEKSILQNISVLCDDDLNFKFNLVVKSTLDINSPETLTRLLDKKGASIVWENPYIGRLPFDSVYNTYIRPVADSTARAIVSKYKTTDIRGNRELIQKNIYDNIKTALRDSPIKILSIVTANFDYPDVITKSVESRRKREIEIDEERAKQAMRLLEVENELKIENKRRAVKAAAAAGDAAAMEILGKALTPMYLKLKEIEATLALYNKTKSGDKVIVTNGNSVMPMVGK